IHVQQPHSGSLQPARDHTEKAVQEREAEDGIFLARPDQRGPVERHGGRRFPGPHLEVPPLAHQHGRPSELVSGRQGFDAKHIVRNRDLQDHAAGRQNIEHTAFIAFAEDDLVLPEGNLASHAVELLDVLRPQFVKRILAQQRLKSLNARHTQYSSRSMRPSRYRRRVDTMPPWLSRVWMSNDMFPGNACVGVRAWTRSARSMRLSSSAFPQSIIKSSLQRPIFPRPDPRAF